MMLIDLDEKLASGVYGTVYKTKDPAVVCKVLTDEDAYNRESLILRDLSHKNVVNMLSFGETVEGLYYIKMERIPRSLADLDVLERPVSEKLEICNIVLSQIIPALRHVHNQGVIHADVKADNIMVHDDGTLVLIDFSNSGFLGMDGKMVQKPNEQFVGGAFGHASPEMLAYMIRYFFLHGHEEECKGNFEERPIYPNTDVYSLGCMLFMILTSTAPITTDSEVDKLTLCHEAASVQSWTLEDAFQSLDRPVQDFLRGMMHHDAEQRMTTRDIMDALENRRNMDAFAEKRGKVVGEKRKRSREEGEEKKGEATTEERK